jgi:DNA-binding LacI/PurR family transcriptional regulator
MHPLLKRQLGRLNLADRPPTPQEWESVLKIVAEQYERMEDDHKMLERSLDLATSEMAEAQDRLRKDMAALKGVIAAVDSAVGISHRRAGRTMAEAIIAAGYRRIGFLGTMMPHDHRARKRLEGFEDALHKAGLSLADREFYSGGSALLKGREMTAAILKRSPDLDFLYYSNDMIGAGGLLYCLHEGIEVPGKVGLAGFNGVDLLDGLPRRLATMDACRLQIGRIAAEIIAGKRPGDVIELSPKLEPGDTIRRA